MSNFSTPQDEIFISTRSEWLSHLQIPAASRNLERALNRRRRIVLDINVRKRSQVQVIQLRGALRMGPAVDSLRQTMDEALSNGDTRMVMNLSEVPMVDSSGIGLLVRYLAVIKQKGGNLKLAQPSKFAVQTLRLVGVLNLFEIFDNDDAAVESFV